jgi:hypothetical protein
MTPVQVVLLVFGILVLVAGVQAAIWIPILRKLRRMPGELSAELTHSGERVVLGPDRAVYRGSDDRNYSIVKGNGVVALTDKRIVFRKAIGKPLEVPISAIEGIRESPTFLRSWANGRQHLILKLRSGGEVGFFVPSNREWIGALGNLGAPAK